MIVCDWSHFAFAHDITRSCNICLSMPSCSTETSYRIIVEPTGTGVVQIVTNEGAVVDAAGNTSPEDYLSVKTQHDLQLSSLRG